MQYKNCQKCLLKTLKSSFETYLTTLRKPIDMRAEATKTLRELHQKLPLDVFLRVADCAVRPLVILHIPKTEAVIQKLRETATRGVKLAKAGSQVYKTCWLKGIYRSVENGQRKTNIIRDVMFKQQTVTNLIVSKFKLAQTTLHRQIYGKKYPGGGQKLEKMREIEGVSASGFEKVAAVILKKPKETRKKPGRQRGSNIQTKERQRKCEKVYRKRTAAEIRMESTAEAEKKKCKAKKDKEEQAEEEDEDKPTCAEIAASKPANKQLMIHHIDGVVPASTADVNMCEPPCSRRWARNDVTNKGSRSAGTTRMQSTDHGTMTGSQTQHIHQPPLWVHTRCDSLFGGVGKIYHTQGNLNRLSGAYTSSNINKSELQISKQ